MSEWQRILDEGSDDLACKVLRAAVEEDVVPPDLQARTTAALGIGSAGLAGVLTGKLAGKWALGGVWKWVGLAAIGGGVVATAAIRHDDSREKVAISVAASGLAVATPIATAHGASIAAAEPVVPSASASASAPPLLDDPPGPRVDVVPRASTAVVARAEPAVPPNTAVVLRAEPPPTTAAVVAAEPAATPTPEGASAAASPPSSASPPSRGLATELAALNEARGALAAGDATRALARLDAYEREFPRGALSQEAAVTRVEALLALGEKARAREAGERFLAAHPGSTHAEHLRTLLRGARSP